MELFIHKNGQTFGPYSPERAFAKVGLGAFSGSDLAIVHGKTDWAPLRRYIRVSGEEAPRHASVPLRPPRAVKPKAFGSPVPTTAFSGVKPRIAVRQPRRSSWGILTGHPEYIAISLLQIACVLMLCSAPPAVYAAALAAAFGPIAMLFRAKRFWTGYALAVATIVVPVLLWAVWINPRNVRAAEMAARAERNRRAVELREQREAADRAAIQETIAEAEARKEEEKQRALATVRMAQQQDDLKKTIALGQAEVEQRRVLEEQGRPLTAEGKMAEAVAKQEVKETLSQTTVQLAQMKAKSDQVLATGVVQEVAEEQDRMARERELADAESKRLQALGNLEGCAKEKLISIKAEPDLMLSKQAQHLAAVVTVGGEKLARFKQIQEKRDWWAWLEEFSGQHYSVIPDLRRPIGDVDSAARNAMRMELALTLSLKAPGAPGSIRVLGLPKVEGIKPTEFPVIYDVLAEWKRSSDGLTYLYPANASDGRLLIFVAPGHYVRDLLGQPAKAEARDARGNATAVSVPAESDASCPAGAELWRIKQGFDQSLNDLRQEKELFKLSPEEVEKRCRQLQSQVQKAVLTFVDRY